ncbi:MAG: DedA family protein [Deltaproteobacteria bacterium]|jgi:membrane protein DedA with SNARE-associated domain|nr:DedA family protein [Deltaproteobacteria bacterium]MDH4007768.1 DedA family protein [Desulfuromonadales bacterium]
MESYIEHFGYLAILIGTFLEGETILILGGFAAHRGYLDLSLVIISAFIGTVFGDQLFYFLGRKHSQTVLNHWPQWQSKIDKSRQMIDQHRILIILSFRFLYGLRTVIPFTLGIANVPARKFVPLNIIGALVWSVAIGLAGYFFGHALEIALGHIKQIELWVMIGIVLSGGIIWLTYLRRAKKKAP